MSNDMKLLVGAALLAVGAASAQLPPQQMEWPKTDFSRRTVELSEIESGGPPVVNAELGGKPYAVFAKPGMASPLDDARIEQGRAIPAATAFGRSVDGRVLDFVFREGKRVDGQTGSEWNVLGEAVAGPLKGKRLPAVESGVHFAFAWLAFNPESEIVRELP